MKVVWLLKTMAFKVNCCGLHSYCEGAFSEALVGYKWIGHFRVSSSLCFKARLSAKPLIWKLILILLQIKLIFTWKVLHLPVASFWKCKCLELGNGLFKILKACYTKQFATTIFGRSQQCRIVVTLFQSLTTSIQHSCTKDPRCNSFSISYSGRCTKKKDRLLWVSKIAKTKVSLAFIDYEQSLFFL